MLGADLDAALKVGAEFKAQGVGSLLTRLGENVKNLREAGEVVELYEAVFARVAEAGLSSEVSVKPTQLGLDIDAAAAYANLERLARAASKAKCFLWIDMEGRAYNEATVDFYRRLHATHPDTGIALHA